MESKGASTSSSSFMMCFFLFICILAIPSIAARKLINMPQSQKSDSHSIGVVPISATTGNHHYNEAGNQNLVIGDSKSSVGDSTSPHAKAGTSPSPPEEFWGHKRQLQEEANRIQLLKGRVRQQ
ncbi:hypothetical protein RJ641_012321 [Dillenia turbinata]|uniref:Uncharacterized protein n=1 Tax=Dillenia turbinata TaxID=194707 RepID=A0AAN8UYZ0_9MAGN